MQFRSKPINKSIQSDEPTPLTIWEVLNQLSRTLDLSMGSLAALMELSEKELRQLSHRKQVPSMNAMVALCRALNISLESLFQQSFDRAALVAQFHGRTHEIPDRFRSHPNSKCRTVIPLLDLIESELGWDQRKFVLRKFQLTEEMFVNPDTPINMRLAVEASDYLLRYYKKPRLLLQVGHLGAQRLTQTPLFSEMVSQKKVSGFFEFAGSTLAGQYLEKNYDWNVERAHSKFLAFSGKPSETMRADPNWKFLIKEAPCWVRSGYLDRLPLEAGFGKLRIKKIACVSQGDRECRWEIENKVLCAQ